MNPEHMFEMAKDNRRGHSLKLYKRRFRLEVGRYKFSNRVCEEWNKLPEEVISVSTLNRFKAQLDRHLRTKLGLI